MATLQSIGLTLVGGSTILALSTAGFGLAVQCRSVFIAARATARPPNVIYNPSPTIKSQQDRGNPWLGWIPWTLQLTYDTMLNGIPGTGTREGGLSGSLLSVNLDGIVLLRFHSLGLRVSCLACILLLLMGLPIYLSAQCYTSEQETGEGCASNAYNLTNYERTTLANVPIVDHVDWKFSIVTPSNGVLWRLYFITGCFWICAGYLCHQLHQEWVQILAMRRVYYLEHDVWGSRRQELKQTLLYEEIAVRKREREEYGRKNSQSNDNLEQAGHHNAEDGTMTSDANNRQQFHVDGEIQKEGMGTKDVTSTSKHVSFSLQTEPHLTHREPWIPHPEQRDTVPNIALYSILVGGLPSLPEQATDSINAESTIQFSKRESIDWQLSLTTTFFDHCVPNQPGFSSSVAAVTIIPGAMDLSLAWRRWYTAAMHLRRLRFIRQQIAYRKHCNDLMAQHNPNLDEEEKKLYEYDGDETNYGYNDESKQTSASNTKVGKPTLKSEIRYGDHDRGGDEIGLSENSLSSNKIGTDYGYDTSGISQRSLSHNVDVVDYGYGNVKNFPKYGYADEDEVFVPVNATDEEIASHLAREPHKPKPDTNWSSSRRDETPRGIYAMPFKNQEYYKQVLGSALGNEHDTHIYDSLGFGPEQAAVYAREFAQSAAPCCPNGFNERRVRHAPMDALLEMERIVAVQVHQANLELREARQRATRADLNLTNIHDAQRGQASHENFAAPQSCVGAANVSAHSTTGAMTSLPKTFASSAGLAPTIEEGNECLEEGNVAQPLASQPMDSRYERRRASNHHDESNALAANENVRNPLDRRNLRIDHGKLATMATSGDLGLEAKLFKKVTGSVMPSIRNHSGQPNVGAAKGSQNKPIPLSSRAKTEGGIPKPPLAQRVHSDGTPKKLKPDLYNAPTLDGLNIPSNLDLEARMVRNFSLGNDSSHSTSIAKQPTDESLYKRRVTAAQREQEKSKLTNSEATSHDDTDDKSRIRATTADSSSAQWEHVESIITETRMHERSSRSGSNIKSLNSVGTGKWEMPTFRKFFQHTKKRSKNIKKFIEKQSKEAIDKLARESTYAVVTFTSRQAAVAARACLADGRGAKRWVTLKELPIPPLADAAPGDLLTFRNCCRPVTLSINERHKHCRQYIAMILLSLIFIFYTIPLTAASKLANPQDLANLIPELDGVSDKKIGEIALLLSGLLTAAIWSLFFALCPVLFKTIANFGSGSNSVANAEFKALQYFWWFMVLTAFSGQLLANMGLNALNEGLSIGTQIQEILRTIALTIPSQISVNWLNWIIFRFTIILPLNYMLQINTFLFYFFGLHCCSRVVRGGGPGGPVPYRIYIDSGVVLMCLLALSPASPLVAPACVAYFLFCQPVLRWSLIFVYRPKFDGGGFRWPFIFDICMTCLYVGTILLAIQMGLKQAIGPAAASALLMIPALVFQKEMKARFLRAFEDAALLQTSLLDGWDNLHEYTVEAREEYRQFLVDAHKAAYVPICLAGTDTDEFLTAEPAVVLEDEDVCKLVGDDDIFGKSGSSLIFDPKAGHHVTLTASDTPLSPGHESLSGTLQRSSDDILVSPSKKTQHGATLRRAVNKIGAMRRRASTVASINIENNDMLLDQQSLRLPFENPTTAYSTRRRSLVSGGESWRSKSAQSGAIEEGGLRQHVTTSPKDLAGYKKSWISHTSVIAKELEELSESIEELSSNDPSSSLANTSTASKQHMKIV